MATAPNTDDPSATVTRFVDAFHKVDVDEMAACFTVPSFILDGMAPPLGASPDAGSFPPGLGQREAAGASTT